MTYTEAKARHAALDSEARRLSAMLADFPRGALGLTPDTVKFSPEYRAVKDGHSIAWSRLRAFNAFLVKHFAKELRAERRERCATAA